MGKRLDIKDQTFERLTARSLIGKDKSGKIIWLCDCICGSQSSVRASDLVAGTIRSCGCLHDEISAEQGRKNHKGHGVSAKNSLLLDYKYRAKKLGLVFELTFEEFVVIIENPCHYCGAIGSTISKTDKRIKSPTSREPYTHNGIDRKDNTLGYTIKNCLPCCKECNYAKGRRNYYEFHQWISRLVSHASKYPRDTT